MVEITLVWPNESRTAVSLNLTHPSGDVLRVDGVGVDHEHHCIKWGEYFSRSLPKDHYPPKRTELEQQLYDWMRQGELPLGLPERASTLLGWAAASKN